MNIFDEHGIHDEQRTRYLRDNSDMFERKTGGIDVRVTHRYEAYTTDLMFKIRGLKG